ncbi:MAG: hypothetical protein LUC31_00975 [Coprobacillus sp.]|nr:hypothetical protein [Coprobacillus sp.]
MAKNEDKKYIRDKYHLHVYVGLLLILLSLVCYFNMWYIARGITYCFSYFFGIMSYVLYIALDVIGFMLIFFRDKMHIKYTSRKVAPFIVFIGVTMLVTAAYVTATGSGDDIHLRTFAGYFSEKTTAPNFKYFDDSFVNLFSLDAPFAGGFFGYLLVAIFREVGSYIVGAIILVAGIGLFFFPNIMRFIRGESSATTREVVIDEEEIPAPILKSTPLIEQRTIVEAEIQALPEPQVIEETPPQPVRETKPTQATYTPESATLQVAHFTRPGYTKPQPQPTSNSNSYNENPSFESERVTPTYVTMESEKARMRPEPPVIEDEVIDNENEVFVDYDDLDDAILNNSEETTERESVSPRVVEAEVTPLVRETPMRDPRIIPEPIVDEEEDITTPHAPHKPRVNWIPPSYELLKDYPSGYDNDENKTWAEEQALAINATYKAFGVDVWVNSYIIGPTFTRFHIEYGPNVAVANVSKRLDDVARQLKVNSLRFEKVVQGTNFSGIEVANPVRITVGYKNMYIKLPSSKEHPLAVPFGVDVVGNPIWGDFSKFPHALIAGATNSGKTVYVQSIVTTLIMRNSPDDLKIILVDPKMVDMTRFSGIPHLLCPIITRPEEVRVCLQKLVDEMEKRYALFANSGSANIESYNRYCREHGYESMPYICLFVDEFADLVERCKDIPALVTRLAAKARAAGINMLIATQRPSTNVVTGTLKANLPVHVALKTSTTTDSITILGEGGAEDLLGYGDMLVQDPNLNLNTITRLQGCYLQDAEIERVVNYLKSTYPVDYDPNFLDLVDHSQDEAAELVKNGSYGNSGDDDDRYEDIKEWVMEQEYTSMSRIQRECSVGFNRAGRIFKRLQEEGIVSLTSDGAKGSRVLVHSSYYDENNIPTSDEVLG